MGQALRSVRRPGVLLLCVVALLGAVLGGCAARHPAPAAPEPAAPAEYDEATFARKEIPSYTLKVPREGRPSETVIGMSRSYTIRPGDTLLDVARLYDLGYNEIIDANPGVDPWIPHPGTTVVLPTEWVLPCCSYQGIVINIPEMRLYYYKRSKQHPELATIYTYPVGLGRDDRRTPRGKFNVSGKTVNPQWNIPESIRREHIRERDDARGFIRGGAPDNPLGKYRLELGRSLYSIHGTDIPWGVGMEVSHGCTRLYPEDIERLFPLVPIGTPVELTYQPVKVGTRGGGTYVEVHRDIYRYERSLYRSARAAIDRQKEPTRPVDAKLVEAAVKQAQGIPVRVSSPRSGAARLSRASDADRRSSDVRQDVLGESAHRSVTGEGEDHL